MLSCPANSLPLSNVMVWHLSLWGYQQARCHRRHTIGMLAAYMPRQHIARLLVDNFRAIINADAVLGHAPPILPARITLAIRFLSAQMLTQATSITFVRVDMLVNRFMADLQSAFQPKPISSLSD